MVDPDPATTARLRRWQRVTVGTLFAGYAGYYVCRSVLPVASNQLLADPAAGVDALVYGRIQAAGIYAYALGKLLTGVAAEYVGGRAVFLAGMILSAGCVAAFGLAAGPAAFLAVWAANRFVQSMGWGGLVQITGRWIPTERLGTLMGVLCVSYLIGDALARIYLGAFVGAGIGWRGLFFVAAGTLAVIAVGTGVLLKSSPKAIGLAEPPPPPGNVHGADTSETPISLRALLAPLVASRMFWLVCLMNAGLTAVRETFNFWTPLYLEKGVGLDPRYAGMLSFVFPLAGMVAALGAGWAADRLGGRFGRLIVPLVAVGTALLAVLAAADLREKGPQALALIAAVALMLIGPYTYCSGVLALRMGGERAAATTAGLVDAAGYLCGAIVSGEIAGRLVQAYGFGPLLEVLVAVSAVTLAIAGLYWFCEARQARRVVESSS